MIFKRKIKWVKIADSLKELEDSTEMNRLKIINVHGKSICIGKNSTGLYAVKNKCPHEGYSFKGGWCSEENKIICPVHRYGFDVETGRGGGTYVDVYQIVEKDDGLFIGINYIGFL